MRPSQTEALVVGAGPVGLWMATLLADAGVETTIIDREERTAARSYACALHPRTLSLLQPLGLADEAIALGRKIKTVAFYDGDTRRAELDLSSLGGDFPFLLILPQNALERALEQRLRKAGVSVQWNHRLDQIKQEERSVSVTLEELGGTSTGYIVPHWETTVKDRFPLHAQFVLGADGHNSLVRQRLGIDFELVRPAEFFAAYEFLSDSPEPDEVRVVLDDTTTNVLWPLPGGRYRWTFQLVRPELPPELPEKERRAVRLAQPQIDERIRQYVEKVARRRAPWFSAEIKEIAWCSEVAFAGRLAAELGRNRCYLAGDAAHQTGPVGVQSMNSGFAEAELLARAVPAFLRNGSLDGLADYDRRLRAQWRRALATDAAPVPGARANDWLRSRSSRLLPCLPGCGDDLGRLWAQLGFEWPALSK